MLLHALVLSFLLYRAEMWSLLKNLIKINSFNSKASRTIENIRWYCNITNKELCAYSSAHSLLPPSCSSNAFIKTCTPSPARLSYQGIDAMAVGWRRSYSRFHTRCLNMSGKDLQKLNVTLQCAEGLAWNH